MPADVPPQLHIRPAAPAPNTPAPLTLLQANAALDDAVAAVCAAQMAASQAGKLRATRDHLAKEVAQADSNRLEALELADQKAAAYAKVFEMLPTSGEQALPDGTMAEMLNQHYVEFAAARVKLGECETAYFAACDDLTAAQATLQSIPVEQQNISDDHLNALMARAQQAGAVVTKLHAAGTTDYFCVIPPGCTIFRDELARITSKPAAADVDPQLVGTATHEVVGDLGL